MRASTYFVLQLITFVVITKKLGRISDLMSSSQPAGERRAATASIDGLSIGEERKCLNQIYRASKDEDSAPDPHWLLYNGMTAGSFCMLYVIGHHKKRMKKDHKSKAKKQSQDGMETHVRPVD